MEEFCIPSNLDGVGVTLMGSYMISRPYDSKQINTTLEDFSSGQVKLEEAAKAFPLFYSATVNIAELSEFTLTGIWKLLYKYVNKLDNGLSKIEEADSERKNVLRNVMKIILFSFGEFIQAVDKETRKTGTSLTAIAKKGRKKNENSVGRFANWNCERISAMESLLKIVDKYNLNVLFDSGVADQELVSSISNTCYRLLGNPDVCKDRDATDLCIDIVATLVCKYGHGSLCPYQVPSLLTTSQYIAPVLARMFEVIIVKHGETSILVDLMREITSVSDTVADSLIIKNSSDLLVLMCEKISDQLLPFVSYLDSLLNQGNASLRSAALSSFAELIKNSLTKPELNEKEEKHKELLLDSLLNHIKDLTAHVRAKAVRLLTELLTNYSIPVSRQGEILSIIAERLKDSSSLVRKNALAYLVEFARCNVMFTRCDPSKLDDIIDEKQKHVAQLKEQVGVDQKTDDEWEQVSNGMCKYFKKNCIPKLPEDLNNLERPKGSLHQELAEVTKLLDKEEFNEAIVLIQRCYHWFPECTIFRKTEQKSKEKAKKSNEEADEDADEDVSMNSYDEAEKENNENESSKMEDEEEEESQKNDIDWLEMARTIYLRKPPKKQAQPQELTADDEMPVTQKETELQAQTESEILLAKLHKNEQELQALEELKHCFSVYSSILPTIQLMLYSKATTDILGAVNFYVTVIRDGISLGINNISGLAHLYAHREESVRNAVETAFEELYLTCDSGDVRRNSVLVARKLVTLMMNCTLAEANRWGNVIAEMVSSKKIPSEVVMVFFEIGTGKLDNTTSELARSAAVLLISVCARKKPAIVTTNQAVVYDLAKNINFTRFCVASLSALSINPRWELENEIFGILKEVLVNNFDNLNINVWNTTCFDVVTFIFKACNKPLVFLSSLASQVIEKATETTDGNLQARVFALGQNIASRLYVFLDMDYQQKLQQKGKKKRNKSLSESKLNVSSKEDPDATGLIGAVADEADAEYIVYLLENFVVANTETAPGVESAFLGEMLPLVVQVLKNPKQHNSIVLQRQAVITLISLMLLSNKVYDEHISLLFTILERSSDDSQKINIISLIPDLCKTFPNSFDPWTSKVYEILKREKSFEVRKVCMVVLSDLIMHDQIKVKGAISDVARCLIDINPELVQMTETLFTQLAIKNNSLYNVLPDIISRLSDENVGVNQEEFNKIMTFLFQQLPKEKRLETFVEKLCIRFRSSTTDQQFRNLAFCLKQIPYNERSLRKLQDNISCFADKLVDDVIYDTFMAICTITAKNAKSEIKLAVAEFESALVDARKSDNANDGTSDDSRPRMSSQVSSDAQSHNKTVSSRRPPASAKKPTKKPKKKLAKLMDSDDDSDDDFEGAVASNSKRGPAPATPSVQTSKRTRRAR